MNRFQKENKENSSRSTSKPIKTTKYCHLWKQVTVEMDGGGIAAIELITVRELNSEEIRFTYYKKESDGKLRFIPRPLDLPFKDLKILLSKAREAGIMD